jgi:hypothetical protein
MAQDPRDYAIRMFEGTPRGSFEEKIEYFRIQLPKLSLSIREKRNKAIINILEPLLAQYNLEQNEVCLLELGINPSEIDIYSNMDAALILSRPAQNTIEIEKGYSEDNIGIEDKLKNALAGKSIDYNNSIMTQRNHKECITLNDYLELFGSTPEGMLVSERCAFLFSEAQYGNTNIEEKLKSTLWKYKNGLKKGIENEIKRNYVQEEYPIDLIKDKTPAKESFNIKTVRGGLMDIKLFEAMVELSPEYKEDSMRREWLGFLSNNKIFFRAIRNSIHLRRAYEVDNVFHFRDELDEIKEDYFWLVKDLNSEEERIKEYLTQCLNRTKDIIYNSIRQKPLSAASSEYGSTASHL